jgi:hypothetical protein
MNKKVTKITLHRETVRRLTVPDLKEVAGGATITLPCTISCDGTCHGASCKTICNSICCP